MKFKSDIEVQAGIKDKDGQIGSSGQILASTGSQVDWIDQSDIISASSKLVVIACKNTSGATITKGTPVYQTGTVGATDVIEIAKADASDENKMAAIGLLQTDLINNAFGNVVITGELLNLITSPIDGTTPTTGDTIYVKPGGGLTLTKPTGVNFIQNVGLIGKVSTGNSGSITVSSIMRSNDVPTPLYIDHANQRLGIGTTSPSEKLEVDGNIKSKRITLSHSGYTGYISQAGDFGGGPLYIRNMGQNHDINFQGNKGGTTSTSLHIDGLTHNIGIGTTSPSQKLEVSGNSLVTGTQFIGDTFTKIQQASGNLLLTNQSSSGAITFLTNSSEKLRITSSGNVGIGTTSPDYALHVDPTVKIGDRQGTDGSLILQSQQGPNITFTSTGDNLDISGSTGSSNGNTIRLLDEIKVFEFHANIGGTIRINRGNRGLMDTNIGGYVVQQQNTTSSNGKSTFLSTDSSGTILRSTSYGGTGTSGDIQFQFGGGNNTSEPAPATKVIIKNDGKVGIGTASPSTNLEIVTSDPSNGIKLTTNTGNLWGTLLNTNSNAFPVGKLALRFGTSETASITARSNEMRIGGSQMNLTLYTSSSEKFRVDTNGNVGIGTTSPSTKLHVQGAASGYLFRVQGTSTLNVYDPGAAAEIGVGSGSGDKLKLFSNDSLNNGITIDTSGNVGIGTTSPAYILDVVSSGTATARLKSAGTGAISLRYENSGGFKSAAVVDNNGLYRLDATNISLNPTNNVGIGTTSPSEKLDVRGNVYIEGSLPYIKLKRDTSGLQEYSIKNEGNFTIEKTTLDSGGSFIIKDENGRTPLNVSMGLLNPDTVISGDLFVKDKDGLTTKLYVNNGNGNVGIGTTSPSLKLQVVSSSIVIADFNTTSTKGGIKISEADEGGYLSTEANRICLGSDIGISNNNLSYHMGTNSLGIGTGSPTTPLHIKHDAPSIRLEDNTSGDNHYLTGNNGEFRVQSTGYITIRPGNTVSTRFDANGNVGIGTTAPSEKLHIDGGKMLITHTSTEQYNYKYGSSDTWSFGGGDYYTIKKAGNRLFTLNGGGNVGIGTTSPTQKLHVDGNTLISAERYYYVAGGGGGFGSDASGNFKIRQNGADLIFGSGNNVGIGTTSPSYKLDVNGGARAGGVVTYSKNYGSLTTTGYAMAGLTSSGNGGSARFTFTCFGHVGGYQKIVYSCYNDLGTWKTKKVIDEGTNDFDVAASADGSTITFTFKSTSGTKNYTPTVTVEAVGSAINSSYA